MDTQPQTSNNDKNTDLLEELDDTTCASRNAVSSQMRD